MSRHAEVEKAAAALKEQHNIEVDILINATSVGPQFDWLKEEGEFVEKMIDGTFKSSIWLVRCFLPQFLTRHKGHIVTLSSTAGIIPTPRKFLDLC